jgi:pheromone a factor receptor
MLDIALIFFSFIGFILCLLPLPVHWRARNTGTLLIILWSSLGCLFVFLNCVVWANSYKDRAPVLCDISKSGYFQLPVACSLCSAVKVQSAYYTGITAASLCVTRRLASIAGARSRIISQRRKRIDLAVDLCLGLGLPILVMIGSYVVQPHRYDIDEAFGCASSVWMSVPAICLLYLWPVVLSAASSVYGGASQILLSHTAG